MAKSLDQVQTEEVAEENQGAPVSDQDTEIVIRMGIQLLSEGGGLKVIEDAINKSQDPASVIGQFLAQLIGQLAEQLGQQVNLDPRVFLAKNGFLDAMLDYIEKKLGYPAEFSDQIYASVLETIKAAAMSPPAPNDVMQQGQPQQEAAMPPVPAQPGIPQAGGMQ